jgi:hypothetical protein
MNEDPTTPAGTIEPPPQRLNLWLAAMVLAVIGLLVGGSLYLGARRSSHKLDPFARCLAAKQVKMYGLFWCPHCAEQKKIFGASFQYVPYVECGVRGTHGEESVCRLAGVKDFPTWQFADGSRVIGTQQLSLLSAKTGCSLP